VEAMMLHIAAMAAFFVDQVQQAPVMVQCAQAAPEKWWRPLSQFAQTIIPVFGGVWIAWMAFRWNSEKERARWVLDQKKAEWREILEAIKVCEDFLPLTSTTLASRKREETPPEVMSDAYQRTRRVQQLFYDRLFVDRIALGLVLSKWNAVNQMIRAGENPQGLEYTSAYIELVDFTRRVAREDLGVRD
jgi:hypothetical protein